MPVALLVQDAEAQRCAGGRQWLAMWKRRPLGAGLGNSSGLEAGCGLLGGASLVWLESPPCKRFCSLRQAPSVRSTGPE